MKKALTDDLESMENNYARSMLYKYVTKLAKYQNLCSESIEGVTMKLNVDLLEANHS